MLEDVRKHIEKLIALYEAEKAENERLRGEFMRARKPAMPTGDKSWNSNPR